jgi:hypothetical protein
VPEQLPQQQKEQTHPQIGVHQIQQKQNRVAQPRLILKADYEHQQSL